MRRNNEIECPEIAQHTEAPSTYQAWHDWATEMEKTHIKRKCPACGLWAIWVEKEATGR